ncbi:MAG: alpha/beta fold hydrolase [Deltaproteobacteria bacterium]|nr:alpha/beta fold hydrolase [Deltaproteobacteria bacterium]
MLFNGATLPLQFWDPVARDLAIQDRVLRLDQRNAGDTRASGSFSLLDVAADAAALLDHLQIERVIVAGHAWGGPGLCSRLSPSGHRIGHLRHRRAVPGHGPPCPWAAMA